MAKHLSYQDRLTVRSTTGLGEGFWYAFIEIYAAARKYRMPKLADAVYKSFYNKLYTGGLLLDPIGVEHICERTRTELASPLRAFAARMVVFAVCGGHGAGSTVEDYGEVFERHPRFGRDVMELMARQIWGQAPDPRIEAAQDLHVGDDH